MAESTGFTHITVTPDEDDDIVIQAGIVADEPLADEPIEEAPDEEAAFEEVACEEAPEPAEGPAEEPAPAPRAARPDDGYRETTLEDLQAVKMSTTQKAVIAVAVLGIVAFIVWYLLAR